MASAAAATAAAAETALHTVGYALVGQLEASDLPSDEDMALDPQQRCTIFNCSDTSLLQPRRTHKRRKTGASYSAVDAHGDGRRAQTTIRSDTRGWRRFVRAVRKMLQGALPHHDLCRDYSCTEYVLIQSKARCQQQAAHTDYEPSPELRAAVEGGAGAPQVPLAMLVALELGTTLEVWPGSIGAITRRDEAVDAVAAAQAAHGFGTTQRLALDVGQVVVFRADLVHAGSAYRGPHRRLHAFWDAHGVPRPADTTFLIAETDTTLAKALHLGGGAASCKK